MRGAREAPAPRDSLNFRRASLLSRNEFECGTFTIVFHATSSFTYVSVIYGANFPFKSIFQWRERQSESFSERILQALKGPCGSSTPHRACVFHTRSNCSFIDSFHAQWGNVTIKTPQDSQHPRARAVYIGNVVIPCQCVVKISPRCLCVLTWGMGTPFIRTSGLSFAFLPIARCLLLGALKSMPHLSAHDAAVSRSELRRAQLDMRDLSAVCNVVSSAKIELWLWVDSGRSLIKIRKSTGPRTVPCGIPDFGVSGADVVPSKRTHCSLCVRKLANHSVADELNSIKESLLNSPVGTIPDHKLSCLMKKAREKATARAILRYGILREHNSPRTCSTVVLIRVQVLRVCELRAFAGMSGLVIVLDRA